MHIDVVIIQKSTYRRSKYGYNEEEAHISGGKTPFYYYRTLHAFHYHFHLSFRIQCLLPDAYIHLWLHFIFTFSAFCSL